MAYYYITVSQRAEEQAFLVRDIDGVQIVVTLTQTGAEIGSIFGTPGTIIGGIVGAITGVFFAIFGDKKKGAMNMYRALIAEILGQVDPGSVNFLGEHDAVHTTRPAVPEIMFQLVKDMLVAFQSTFEYGSDDWNDAQEAIDSVELRTDKPCCNRTIIQFEGTDASNNILSGGGGLAVLFAIGAAIYAD